MYVVSSVGKEPSIELDVTLRREGGRGGENGSQFQILTIWGST